jgi:hypothetical protein
MDSTLDYIHWEKSSLTIFADAWIGDPTPQELIVIPEEFDFDPNLETQLNTKESKKPQKTEWKPDPMEL